MSQPLRPNAVEQFFYETRPYTLFFIAIYSITSIQSMMMVTSGITLLFCSVVILRLRLKHRGYIKW